MIELIQSFRYEDEDNYEYETYLKSFFAYTQKLFNPESFIVLFSPEKLVRLLFLDKV